jgi:hypothetical protein
MTSDEQVPKPSWWFVLLAAFIGAIAGGVVGAGLGYASYEPSDDWLNFGAGFAAIVGAVFGAPIGATLAAVGWSIWRVRL